MNRIFTFGCSFTNYIWPSWSDLLNTTDTYDVENWGHSGFGNEFISKRIVECHAINNFTPDDTIIIVWSEHLRFDIMKEDFVWFQNRIHDNAAWNEHAGYFKSITNILLTVSFLRQLGVNLHMSSIIPLHVNERELFFDLTVNSMYEKYPDLRIFEEFNTGQEWLPSFEGGIFSYFHSSKEKYKVFVEDKTLMEIHNKDIIIDRHFIPTNHYKWLEKSGLLDKLQTSEVDRKIMKKAAKQWDKEVLDIDTFTEILNHFASLKDNNFGITKP